MRVPSSLLRRLGLPALLACALAAPAHAVEVTVYAAASLSQALQEAVQAWKARTGHVVRASFAASSTLARQIENGAPAALFLSADEAWMDYLAQRGRLVPGSRVDLLGNRLVLVTPADRPQEVRLAPGFDLAAVLGKGRLATGDPAHVPVGKYAQAALTRLGVWPQAQPRLVRADSVRAALAYVERGEAAAGIVYATDAAVAPRVHVAGVFPADSHPRIVYPMALVAGQDSEAARALHDFLQGQEAAEVFMRHGFAVLAMPPAVRR